MDRVELEDALEALRARGLQVRDVGLLDSALARPVASAFGLPAYGSLALAAAAQTESIVRNHPLFDGNKRTGLYLLAVFLRLNGLRLVAGNDELYEHIVAAARGDVDLDQSASFIADRVEPWR
ncbi:type II toxin-antitoxin system death-on-curing family toxin [Sediminivirga luteola]|uniref:type II toxin-antitoxin system death-on-curing family toxin n=1 Tax=Sediminivirga luteola TaxID=1774748 RepID=UPI001F573189|nr:type II toxin-antitoxin system death-on-curing family toxin [Sediminivirga luteola]MCI2264548.1 type II toxin-antitoxin system death-on-curing family toxin [Sediminivirga luteola]